MPRKLKKFEGSSKNELTEIKQMAAERGSESLGGKRLRVDDPKHNREALNSLRAEEAQELQRLAEKLGVNLHEVVSKEQLQNQRLGILDPKTMKEEQQKLRLGIMNPKTMDVASIQRFVEDEPLRVGLIKSITNEQAKLAKLSNNTIAKERLEVLEKQKDAAKYPLDVVVHQALSFKRGQRERTKNLRNANTEKLDADIDALEGILRAESQRKNAERAAELEKMRLAVEAWKEQEQQKAEAEAAALTKREREHAELVTKKQEATEQFARESQRKEREKLEAAYEAKRLTAPAILSKLARQNMVNGEFDHLGYERALNKELDRMIDESEKTGINRYDTVGARMIQTSVDEAIAKRITALEGQIQLSEANPGEQNPYLPLIREELADLKKIQPEVARTPELSYQSPKEEEDIERLDSDLLRDWDDVEQAADTHFLGTKKDLALVDEVLGKPEASVIIDPGYLAELKTRQEKSVEPEDITLKNERVVSPATRRALESQAAIARKGQEFRDKRDAAIAKRKARQEEARLAALKAAEEAKAAEDDGPELEYVEDKTKEELLQEQITELENSLKKRKAAYSRRFGISMAVDRARVENKRKQTGLFASLRRGLGQLTNSDEYQRDQAFKEFQEEERQLSELKITRAQNQEGGEGAELDEQDEEFLNSFPTVTAETEEPYTLDTTPVVTDRVRKFSKIEKILNDLVVDASGVQVELGTLFQKMRLNKPFDERAFRNLREEYNRISGEVSSLSRQTSTEFERDAVEEARQELDKAADYDKRIRERLNADVAAPSQPPDMYAANDNDSPSKSRSRTNRRRNAA